MKEYQAYQKAFILASFETDLKKRCYLADNALANFRRTSEADKVIAKMEKYGISVITSEDDEYPGRLQQLNYAPPALYYKGNLDLLKTDCVTIVGSRRASRYGVEAAEYFASGLAERGITIVSGLAMGIDAAAHRGALKSKGNTIAIMACGLDRVYPQENAELMEEIAQRGLLLSEYPPGTPPLAFRFPERNRIMATISKGVLVAEAGKKSGALITADCALEMGKELWVVPGNIFSRSCEGSNELLKECGRLVTRIGDIIADTGGEDDGVNLVGLTENEKLVLEAIDREGTAHYSRLAQDTGISIPDIAKLLMKLELNGIVKRHTGNYYSIAKNRH